MNCGRQYGEQDCGCLKAKVSADDEHESLFGVEEKIMRKMMIIVGIMALLVLGLTVIYQARHHNNLSNSTTKALSVVDVEEVIGRPEQYTGRIAVSGRVIKTEASQSYFVFGCPDGCLSMMVKYKGSMPWAGTDVVAYGEVKKSPQGKYFFEATETKVK